MLIIIEYNFKKLVKSESITWILTCINLLMILFFLNRISNNTYENTFYICINIVNNSRGFYVILAIIVCWYVKQISCCVVERRFRIVKCSTLILASIYLMSFLRRTRSKTLDNNDKIAIG